MNRMKAHREMISLAREARGRAQQVEKLALKLRAIADSMQDDANYYAGDLIHQADLPDLTQEEAKPLQPAEANNAEAVEPAVEAPEPTSPPEAEAPKSEADEVPEADINGQVAQASWPNDAEELEKMAATDVRQLILGAGATKAEIKGFKVVNTKSTVTRMARDGVDVHEAVKAERAEMEGGESEDAQQDYDEMPPSRVINETADTITRIGDPQAQQGGWGTSPDTTEASAEPEVPVVEAPAPTPPAEDDWFSGFNG